jgi:hypothetical protein
MRLVALTRQPEQVCYGRLAATVMVAGMPSRPRLATATAAVALFLGSTGPPAGPSEGGRRVRHFSAAVAAAAVPTCAGSSSLEVSVDVSRPAGSTRWPCCSCGAPQAFMATVVSGQPGEFNMTVDREMQPPDFWDALRVGATQDVHLDASAALRTQPVRCLSERPCPRTPRAPAPLFSRACATSPELARYLAPWRADDTLMTSHIFLFACMPNASQAWGALPLSFVVNGSLSLRRLRVLGEVHVGVSARSSVVLDGCVLQAALVLGGGACVRIPAPASMPRTMPPAACLEGGDSRQHAAAVLRLADCHPWQQEVRRQRRRSSSRPRRSRLCASIRRRASPSTAVRPEWASAGWHTCCRGMTSQPPRRRWGGLVCGSCGARHYRVWAGGG